MPRKGDDSPPEPALPNVGSPGQTPASLLIDVHYGTLFLVERWTWDRYIRLCAFLRMTPCEVASLVLLRHETLANFQRRNRLCGPGAKPTAMLLTLVEAHSCRGLTDDLIEKPFPDISKA